MEGRLEHLVGQRVRQLRNAARLTKAQLCLMTGISRPYLDRIEDGTANITLRVLERLAQSLDVSMVNLVANEEHPGPQAPEPRP